MALSTLREVFGSSLDREWQVKEDKVKVHRGMLGKSEIHVLSATEEGGMIHRFSYKKGEGLYRVACCVTRLAEAIDRENGRDWIYFLKFKELPKVDRSKCSFPPVG